MRSRHWRPATAAVIAGVLLAGCGGDGQESKPSASASPTESSSPTPSAAPLNITEPRGKYKVILRRATVKPKRQTWFPKRDRTIWKFKTQGCDDTGCHGRVRSETGAVYDYQWDGSQLTITRPTTGQRLECADPRYGEVLPGSGSVRVRYRYQIDPEPFLEPLQFAPRRLKGTYAYLLHYRNWRGCQQTKQFPIKVEFTFVARKARR